MMRAFACSLVALAGLAVAAPSANPPPEKIKRGVRIGHVRVGGLSAEPARARVRRAFDRSLRFHFQDKRWKAAPLELGATTSAGDAVTRALRARPRARVKLRVKVNRAKLREYVARLDHKLSRPAVDAQAIGLTSNLQPIISEGRPGLRVDRPRMVARIVRALDAGKRTPIALAVDWVQPDVTAATFGPVIVIKRDSHQLVLYNGTSLWQTFPVATGQAAYPTPTGAWSIVDMQVNPWWRPPPGADWAAGAEPIPPGPGNPLGTRWMGLSAPGVGIHATPDDASVGYSASHGCIRMHLPDAEWLFNQVHIGTPVYIVSA
jgi:lipoprotein-anchoring transpeptidase ErfK/SrfK